MAKKTVALLLTLEQLTFLAQLINRRREYCSQQVDVWADHVAECGTECAEKDFYNDQLMEWTDSLRKSEGIADAATLCMRGILK